MLNFLFNVTATTEIYTYRHTLALHDALPISRDRCRPSNPGYIGRGPAEAALARRGCRARTRRTDRRYCRPWDARRRSEEHTSELQSIMRISFSVFCVN